MFAEVAACGTTCLTGKDVPVNKVKQIEAGVKMRSGNFSSFVTLFNAKTDESNYDLTKPNAAVTYNKYNATGVEVEAGYKVGIFRINGGVTYTSAKVADSSNLAYKGKAPDRQAKLIYQVAPSVRVAGVNAGMSFIGTSSSMDAQTSPQEAQLPAYMYSNLFVNMDVAKGWNLGVAVNNVFNKVGYTEVNSDRTAARSINGRTFKLAAKYSF